MGTEEIKILKQIKEVLEKTAKETDYQLRRIAIRLEEMNR